MFTRLSSSTAKLQLVAGLSALDNHSFLRYQAPPPSLFFDRFVSVYPVQEVFGQVTPQTSSPPQPNFLYTTRSRPRPELFDDHSLETGATNHPFPHVIQIGIGLFPFTFEVPELNSDPWLEWIHPHPPADFYPFRQIYPTLPPQQVMLQMFYKAPNWRIEAEPIWNVPATNNQVLGQFRWQIVIPTLPNVVGDTQAVAVSVMNAAGFFNLTINMLPSISVPAGIVISQLPLPGPVGSFTIPVIINVSIGFQPPGTQIMPNVVGVILREAIQFLQDAGSINRRRSATLVLTPYRSFGCQKPEVRRMRPMSGTSASSMPKTRLRAPRLSPIHRLC